MQALLALEDGRIFRGRSFGDHKETGAEVVFVTAMTGYQEVLTDPSYRGQIVTFTTAHLGNYGIQPGHGESECPWAAGLVIRDLCEIPSHPDSTETLQRYVRRHGLCGVADVDTRALTLHLRRHGVLRGFFTTSLQDPEEAIARARAVPPMRERNVVAEVTTRVVRVIEEEPFEHAVRIAVLDYGVKQSILSELVRQGCRLTVLPGDVEAGAIDRIKPDGVVLSNGPGDPEVLLPFLGTVRHAIERYPTLAICLGHQLAGLALGGRIRKLRFGHHGANHPVKDLRTGQVFITAQNHNYAVDASTLPSDTILTHLNLNDETVEGFVMRDRPLWSYQFHPEGAPGPHDSRTVFREFVSSVRGGGSAGAS